MKILVINCGSSSLKYQLIDMEDESVIAKGLCERIGIEGSKLTHQPAGKDKYVVENPMPSHKVAIEMVMDALQDPEHGVIKSTMRFPLSDTAYCTAEEFTAILS